MKELLKALKIQSSMLWMMGQLIKHHATATSGRVHDKKRDQALQAMQAHCENMRDCSELIKEIEISKRYGLEARVSNGKLKIDSEGESNV